MGLAAGQARLLTITARKSDCEFESMRLSHQKIALSREMADLSNEYQNSLDQSKLIYDYYGTGDTSTPLSYGILMTPSTLNDYMPTTITDTLGRVVLNSQYAAAAKSAGIPQEGLGTLPSEAMRNAFIQGLASKGVISTVLASTILGLPYNQEAGLGGGTTTAVTTTTANISGLLDYIKENITDTFDVQSAINVNNGDIVIEDGDWKFDTSQVTLYNLLSDTETYTLFGYSNGEDYYNHDSIQAISDYMTGKNNSSGIGFIDQLYDQFSSVLDLGDGYTGKALEYALSETKKLFDYSDDGYTNNENNGDFLKAAGGTVVDSHYKRSRNHDAVKKYNKNYVGIVESRTKHDWWTNGAGTALNLNNVAKSFLTFFVKYMDGVASKDADGSDKYHVQIGHLSENKLATSDYLFEYTIKTGTEVSSDDLAQSTFYDALFNQICKNGWTENEKITESSYMQAMLQNGMLFISKMKDDGYYYQGNYATDPYIKEISDDTAIAQAESKYTTEKAKLNTKEETLDLKMKNLDTEISSLTTEYDTVKNTLSKNIEKSFKRYSA
ncbi:MAG: hypothetical protein ACLSA2_00295 [Candidatus Gastranaerophilaceae bacterium]